MISGTVYFLLLFLLCLPKKYLSANNIKIKTLTNLEVLAEKLSVYITNILNEKSDTANQVNFVLPTERDNENVAHLFDKTLQNISSFLTITSNDSVCCDTLAKWRIPYENKFLEFIQDVYVIPIYEEKRIQFTYAQIEIIAREDLFNPDAFFIFVHFTEQCGALKSNAFHSQYEMTFNKLWKYNIFNSSLLIMSSCDLALTVVTAQAFSQENQCRTVQEGGLKYHFLPHKNKDINYKTFFHVKARNFKGCTFWAGTIPYPPYVIGEVVKVGNESLFTDARGVDIEIMRTLADEVNLTIKFYQTHTFDIDAWVTILKNGTIIGFVQDLLEHEIDVTFGGVMPSYITCYKFVYSSAYKFSTLNFFVPNANIIPPWLIFLKVFSVNVWLLSAIVFVLVTLIYQMMSLQSLKGIVFSFLELFKLSIGFSSSLNPKTCYLRVLLFSWAVYCLHWYIAYTTVMYLLITKPPCEKEILTFNDLKQSGLKVSTNAIYLETFAHIKIDGITRRVLENHIVCPQIEKCVAQFLKHRNFSIMGTAETMEFLVDWQQSRIHKLTENILTFSVSFLSSKGNPLNEELDLVIQRALQAGLLIKWEKDVGTTYRLKNDFNEAEKETIILDLKGAFYILCIGKFVALLIFLIEVTIGLLKNSNIPSVSVLYN